jgi:hypothetical protein
MATPLTRNDFKVIQNGCVSNAMDWSGNNRLWNDSEKMGGSHDGSECKEDASIDCKDGHTKSNEGGEN